MFNFFSEYRSRKVIRAFALSVSIFAGTVGHAMADEIDVPLATWGGEKHVINAGFVPPLEEALAKYGPDKLKLINYPNGQLAIDKDLPTGIPTGKVKFALLTVNGWSGAIKDVKVFDAPTGLTMQQLDNILHEKGLLEVLQKKFAEKQTVLMGVADLGPPALVSKKKIMSPNDLKGVKVRVFSEGQADTIKSFGGIPVLLAFTEVYTGLQNGTVDAALVGFQGIESGKLYEVTDFTLLPASFFGTTLMGWAANAHWMGTLPEADRKALEEAVSYASREDRKAILDEIDSLIKHYEEKGMTVTNLSPTSPEYQDWVAVTQPIAEKAKNEVSPEVSALVFAK